MASQAEVRQQQQALLCACARAGVPGLPRPPTGACSPGTRLRRRLARAWRPRLCSTRCGMPRCRRASTITPLGARESNTRRVSWPVSGIECAAALLCSKVEKACTCWQQAADGCAVGTGLATRAGFAARDDTRNASQQVHHGCRLPRPSTARQHPPSPCPCPASTLARFAPVRPAPSLALPAQQGDASGVWVKRIHAGWPFLPAGGGLPPGCLRAAQHRQRLAGGGCCACAARCAGGGVHSRAGRFLAYCACAAIRPRHMSTRCPARFPAHPFVP